MISSNVEFKTLKFPCGEPHLTVKEVPLRQLVDVTFDYDGPHEILELLLLCDAVKRLGYTLRNLEMPYVPFCRQDRVANEGECFSLTVFCKLINDLEFHTVKITDPHSDVTAALLNNVRVIPQHEVFRDMFEERENIWLISPDAGAVKKIYNLAAVVKNLGVIECSKHRNTETGEISGTKVHAENLRGLDCFIVDDICDGGGTFIAAAKALKLANAGKIHLMVSHGFFTKGLGVFDGLIDHIYTRKGQVK
jgi:ribose-phosphate pyrophosphokinase